MSFILRVREKTASSGEDDFGRPITGWAERDWEVRSIAPGSMEEPDRSGRDLSIVMWTVYADEGKQPDENAQVRLPGSSEWYEVEGRPADWTMGPPRVGPQAGYPSNPPGVVVELRRANG